MILQLMKLKSAHRLCSRPFFLLPWRFASSHSVRPKAVTFDMGGVVIPSPAAIFSQFEASHGLASGIIVSTIIAGGNKGITLLICG